MFAVLQWAGDLKWPLSSFETQWGCAPVAFSLLEVCLRERADRKCGIVPAREQTILCAALLDSVAEWFNFTSGRDQSCEALWARADLVTTSFKGISPHKQYISKASLSVY